MLMDKNNEVIIIQGCIDFALFYGNEDLANKYKNLLK